MYNNRIPKLDLVFLFLEFVFLHQIDTKVSIFSELMLILQDSNCFVGFPFKFTMEIKASLPKLILLGMIDV